MALLDISHIASTISLTFSCLCLVDELVVVESLPTTSILSMKTSSCRSATTVETKVGLDSKCFHR